MRFPASRPAVWAVEDDAVQVVWGELPAGVIRARVQDCVSELDHVGGAGAMTVTGLPAGSDLRVELSWDEGNNQRCSVSLEFSTLTPPPGEMLFQLATISDLHLGATRWGFFKTMRDSARVYPPQLPADQHAVSHPYRCASAALDEASAWGAQHVIIKGDAADHRVASSFAEVDQLVDAHHDTAFSIIPGNHDVDDKSDMAIPTTFGQRQIPLTRSVSHLDVPGLRIVLVDTTIQGQGPGTIADRSDAILELSSGPEPVLLAMHHHFEQRPIPTYWPVGIPAQESIEILDRLRAVNPNVFITSGHTHRNHIRSHGPLRISEVGSTKDWPGVWAGYKVFDGGITQSVRRVQTPGAVHWHEYSKGAVLGTWQFWARGSLQHRCVSHGWSPVPPSH